MLTVRLRRGCCLSRVVGRYGRGTSSSTIFWNVSLCLVKPTGSNRPNVMSFLFLGTRERSRISHWDCVYPSNRVKSGKSSSDGGGGGGGGEGDMWCDVVAEELVRGCWGGAWSSSHDSRLGVVFLGVNFYGWKWLPWKFTTTNYCNPKFYFLT